MPFDNQLISHVIYLGTFKDLLFNAMIGEILRRRRRQLDSDYFRAHRFSESRVDFHRLQIYARFLPELPTACTQERLNANNTTFIFPDRYLIQINA